MTTPLRLQDSPVVFGENVALAVHGGAGTILKENLTPEMEADYEAGLQTALRVGWQHLQNGGSALDAVEAAVRSLENDEMFNAGRGAVFTSDGRNELDAAVMDGRTRSAGAVTGIQTVKNPVTLARAIMERTPFVLLSGAGADALAAEWGLETAPPSYFWTAARWAQLEKQRERESASGGAANGYAVSLSEDNKFGTVGAVARDIRGNLAAATSTGGMTNKRYGRVGDSPLIGAGTWADNATCAVSATGHGEYFIRAVVAHDIAARMAYAGLTVQEAASIVVNGALVEMGGDGGVIALDAQGNAALPFNSAGMYRVVVFNALTPYTLVYGFRSCFLSALSPERTCGSLRLQPWRHGAVSVQRLPSNVHA